MAKIKRDYLSEYYVYSTKYPEILTRYEQDVLDQYHLTGVETGSIRHAHERIRRDLKNEGSLIPPPSNNIAAYYNRVVQMRNPKLYGFLETDPHSAANWVTYKGETWNQFEQRMAKKKSAR